MTLSVLLGSTAHAATVTDTFDDGVPGPSWQATIDRIQPRERSGRLEFRSNAPGGGLRFSGYASADWRFAFTESYTIDVDYRVAGMSGLTGNRYAGAGVSIDPAGPVEAVRATVRRDQDGLCVAYEVFRGGERIAFVREPISTASGTLTVRYAAGPDRLLISIDDTLAIRVDDFLADLPTGNGTARLDIGAYRRGPVAWSWGKVYIDDFALTGEIDAPPTIDVWYGDEQPFGFVGVPQHWVNVLGRVSDADGVDQLTYRLNDGPELPLSIGSDLGRLYNDGDFNIDLNRYDMLAGSNTVVIRATDTLGNVAERTVTIDQGVSAVWPLPYEIDWSETSNLLDVAQPVDGLWVLEDDGVRTVEPGFDRLLAIGDVLWTNYAVTVPITINFIDFENGYQPPSNGVGIGFLMRWAGHAPDSYQPHRDYTNFGALAWYQWSPAFNRIRINFPESFGDQMIHPIDLVVGNTYMFKAKVTSVTILGFPHARYRFKFWPAGEPEPEWMLGATAWAGGMSDGSLALIAHHVDATFGDVTIVPVGQ